MASQIEQAIRQICDEKGLSYESVVEAIEDALAAAYRKDFGEPNQNIKTDFDPETGDVEVYDVKTVVEDMDLEELRRKEQERKERMEEFAEQIEEARESGEELPAVTFDEDIGPKFNEKTDIMLSDAQEIDEDAEVGDVLRQELEKPGDFGRMAAMTAKQVITQKLREAEREIVFNEYKQHEGELMNGTVQRREGRVILVDIGRSVGVLRPQDQIPNERYNTGDRLRVYVRQVSLTPRGPEILLSRASEEVVRELFKEEIPEVAEEVVEIKGVAREAGARSKVAVWTDDEQIDPIGACIGQRGTRIQTIIAELSGEKIDIIEWDEHIEQYIINALSPAEIESVEIDEEEEEVVVRVEEDQLSLAIGRGGQNVRLAADLIGMKINIAEVGEDLDADDEEEPEEVAEESAEDIEGEESKQEETEEDNGEEQEDVDTDDVGDADEDVDDTSETSDDDEGDSADEDGENEESEEDDGADEEEDEADDEGEEDDESEEEDEESDE
jgi:N utilization substance protein A